jgi:hypothetical protein
MNDSAKKWRTSEREPQLERDHVFIVLDCIVTRRNSTASLPAASLASHLSPISPLRHSLACEMAHPKDPAAGISSALLPHLHLVSKNRYPVSNNPSLDSIVNFLTDAPKVVRDLQPMQWQMLDAPQDGTMLLVWQPLEYLGNSAASDGYIYADAEQYYKSDVRGFVSAGLTSSK